MVTMCGGGVSSYLSVQLLLMKLWMNCGESANLLFSLGLHIDLWRQLTAGEEARFLTGDGELSPVLW